MPIEQKDKSDKPVISPLPGALPFIQALKDRLAAQQQPAEKPAKIADSKKPATTAPRDNNDLPREDAALDKSHAFNSAAQENARPSQTDEQFKLEYERIFSELTMSGSYNGTLLDGVPVVRPDWRGGGYNPYAATTDDARAIIEFANKYKLDVRDVCAMIGRETAGTCNPNIRGGYGMQYAGLIQFSPDNQRHYGVHPNMTVREQMRCVEAYLVDRFKAAGVPLEGAKLANLYAAVLAGNPRLVDAADCNGSTNQAIARGDFKVWEQRAMKVLGIEYDKISGEATVVAENEPKSTVGEPKTTPAAMKAAQAADVVKDKPEVMAPAVNTALAKKPPVSDIATTI